MEWVEVPADVQRLLDDMDGFIEREILPLQAEHPAFFDHRREFARTDADRGGVPKAEWHALMAEARRRAIAAGIYQYPFPEALGGGGASNLAMAIVREHLARRGPGLHAELSHEASIVANQPLVLVLHEYGTDEQRRRWLDPLVAGEHEIAFALTEPGHGSDATRLQTRAERVDGGWSITGAKKWITASDVAAGTLVFARTSGEPGKSKGISAFLVPAGTPGMTIDGFTWTFNMPTDHAELTFDGCVVGDDALVFEEGRGMEPMQLFVHENRIRQAASSLGAAQFCIDRSVAYALEREIFGARLADQQGVQWQLVELQTDAELIRNTLRKTAWLMDRANADGASTAAKTSVSDKVSMVNYRANQLACRAADRAMQVHGATGYSREQPFEFIYRHHRRYRITEGADELQLRRIAGELFGFTRASRARG